jgi:hypothetical protein
MGRSKKSIGLFIGAALGGILFLLAGAAPASAFDQQDCYRQLGRTNVVSIQSFSIEAGDADFGDELHLFGAPQGDAVVCWSGDGRVAVIGKIYAVNLCLPLRECEPVEAIVEISLQRFNRQTRSFTTVSSTRRSVLSQGGLASATVRRTSPNGQFDRVRIQLFTFSPPALAVPPAEQLVATREFRR